MAAVLLPRFPVTPSVLSVCRVSAEQRDAGPCFGEAEGWEVAVATFRRGLRAAFARDSVTPALPAEPPGAALPWRRRHRGRGREEAARAPPAPRALPALLSPRRRSLL